MNNKNGSVEKKVRWSPMVISVLSILVGVILLMNPQIEMETIALYAGFLFLLYGLLQIISGLLIRNNAGMKILFILFGIAVIVLAILDFKNLELVGKYLPTLIGFFVLVCAVSLLIPAFAMLARGFRGWWITAILAVILVIMGLMCMLKPGEVGQVFGIFTGIALLINGISSLISYIQFMK